MLSTLHASTPIEGVRRLLDLQLKLSDFVPSLIGIFSQRLLRYKINGEYRGRFPIAEYIYFEKKEKNNILKTNDISLLTANKTFQESADFALKNRMTDETEIRRVLGNGAL